MASEQVSPIACHHPSAHPVTHIPRDHVDYKKSYRFRIISAVTCFQHPTCPIFWSSFFCTYTNHLSKLKETSSSFPNSKGLKMSHPPAAAPVGDRSLFNGFTSGRTWSCGYKMLQDSFNWNGQRLNWFQLEVTLASALLRNASSCNLPTAVEPR